MRGASWYACFNFMSKIRTAYGGPPGQACKWWEKPYNYAGFTHNYASRVLSGRIQKTPPPRKTGTAAQSNTWTARANQPGSVQQKFTLHHPASAHPLRVVRGRGGPSRLPAGGRICGYLYLPGSSCPQSHFLSVRSGNPSWQRLQQC